MSARRRAARAKVAASAARTSDAVASRANDVRSRLTLYCYVCKAVRLRVGVICDQCLPD
jgi:hypothetical protein